MTYAHKLKYAGSDPFTPEREREDITHREMEQLEQDETYQHLAEVRWLASELQHEIAGDVDVAEEARAHIFRAVATDDAPLAVAVDAYVERWLAEFREPSRSEPADFGHGESTGVQDL